MRFEDIIRSLMNWDRKTAGDPRKWIALWPIFLLAMYMFSRTSSYVPYSDDLSFAELYHTSTLSDAIWRAYRTWSGRVVPQGMMYLVAGAGTAAWRIMNSIVLVLFAFGMLRLITGSKIRELGALRLCLMAVMTASAVLFIHRDLKREALFWMTGSVSYLWPVTAGLYALIPARDYLQDTSSSVFQMALALPLTVIIAFSQEQGALLFLFVLLLLAFCQWAEHGKLHPFFVVQIVLALAITALLLGAPGNMERFHAEEKSWYPGFSRIPVLEKIHLGMIWLFEHFVGRDKKIFILLWVSSTIYLMRFARLQYLKKLFFLPAAGVLLLLSAQPDWTAPFFGMVTDFKSGQALPWIAWGGLIGFIPVLLLFSGTVRRGSFLMMLFMGSILSASLMFFSPTIYASALRPFFVMDTGLVVLSFFLLYESVLVPDFVSGPAE